MMNRRTALSVLPLLLLSRPVRAHSYTAGDIAIGHVWGLPAQSGETQVFAPMNNRGKDKDALVAARSSICSMIELRQNNRYDDPALQSIDLLPGKPIAMRPKARHLRLIGLKRELKSGDRFDLILDFLNAGEAPVEVYVESAEGH
jgi:periplasmic copper chaperone A